VSGSDTHTIAIDGEGNVWSWGDHALGHSGNGAKPDRVSLPVKCIGAAAGKDHTLALTGTSLTLLNVRTNLPKCTMFDACPFHSEFVVSNR
jgi:hypothetical protein